MTADDKIVRIGGASGFWGDSAVAAPQLVAASPAIDYLVFDYLAETTMAILAAARTKRPELGYATDFVDVAMRPVLREVAARGIKVVSNAGGIHPRGCAEALQRLLDAERLDLKVAVVEGDDISAQLDALRAAAQRDLAGAPLPERMLSASAYLGALPIARALAAGADIVVTGRCVDSAVTLGPLIHEFGWAEDDFNRLAGGSLAGHLIECGCQATGGLFTDWEDVPDWAGIGYPIAECRADGSFAITKPAGSGGLVVPAVLAEQLLYEIGDPGAYVLPDVVCDFREVVMTAEGADRVVVRGARGRAPTARYKVSATAQQGWRCAGSLVIVGIDAVRKAERTGAAIAERTRRMLAAAGFADFTELHVEVLGAEASYGPRSRARGAREVMLRVVADHADRRALELFAREIAPAGTSWSPGTTGPGGGRPSVAPLVRPLAFLLDKTAVAARFTIGGREHAVAVPAFAGSEPARPADAPVPPPPAAWAGEPQETVALVELAWARSGDKGDLSNIGVVARRREWLPLLWERLTTERVAAHFAHLVRGRVERFPLEGIAAINFLLHEALAGGGPASPRLDPLGKGMAQQLLDIEIEVPRSVALAARNLPARKPVWLRV